jgi:hypothetical protein
MLKDLVLKLKFLGVIPQIGYVEYGFQIEDEDKSRRLVVLTIEDLLLHKNSLMLQEAPDLCYQKILANLEDETTDARIPSRMPVTASDIANYRDVHPTTKLNRRAQRASN